MEVLPIALCSACREPLNAKGECLVCLLRGGLPVSEEYADAPGYGDFEIESRADGSLWELGAGAMGVTYRARDTVLNRAVALKVIEIPPSTVNAEAVRTRFLREARAAAALKHVNVAGIYQFGVSPESDRCFYAMELVEGETLEALVRREGPLATAAALDLAIQVTRALVAAAGQGLVHRDLKPGNIMMVDSGEKSELEVKVIDFGLAKALNAVAEADLTHGSFVGTPAFASPEQFAGMPANARSDIYSLGVTLWYALTGQVPNPGQTIPEIRARQQEWSLPIEQLKQRKVPASLIEILRSALALDPARRPTSAKDLLGKLEDCRSKIRAPFRRRILALAVVLLLMLAAISVFFLRKNPPRAAEKSSASSELPTSDLTAFALYNEARNLSVRTDLNEWSHKRPQVIALLQEAIARDPKFVLAYCSLANVYAHAHTDAFVAGQDSEPVDKLWREAIDHALQLRPDLGEPHLALAGYDLFLSKFDQARAEIGIARRLLPDNSDALFVEARIDRRQNRWVDSLVPALRAHDLDPQNAGLIEWIIEDYRLLRRYDEGERFATQAMVKKPEFTSTLYERIAEMKLCEVEPAAAQEILERLSPERGIGARFEAALYLRDYDRAAKVLAAAPVDKAENISDGKPPPSLADATLARARGDERAAQAAFQGAREDLENRTKPRNRNEFYFSSLAVLDAGLGRKAEAIREAQRAVDLVPLARDPVFGMAMIEGQAQVYAWTGEDDLALKKLELLSKIPSEISYGNLRFDPGWDSLRGNPRFEKIVASLKPNAQRPTTR